MSAVSYLLHGRCSRLLMFALVLGLTTSLYAKECIGTFHVELRHSDGSITTLYEPSVSESPDIEVTLLIGDTVFIFQELYGDLCFMTGMRATRVELPDTANETSPVIFGYFHGQERLKISQSGSYFITHLVPFIAFTYIRVTIHAPYDQIPHPADLQFYFADEMYQSTHYLFLHVPFNDTCEAPCKTAYLTNGQFLRMRPLFGDIAQPGGSAIVRFFPEGAPMDTAIEPQTIDMNGYEGYQFNEDGNYLISVTGTQFSSSGLAHVRISHQPYPRIDMELTIERADGTLENVVYQPSNIGAVSSAIDLGPGDSLRIDHHELTESLGPVTLMAYRSPNWAPPYGDQYLWLDTLSSTSGIRIATPGSYRLWYRSEGGAIGARTFVTINAPTPHRELVVKLVDQHGAELDMFRASSAVAPPPIVNVQLNEGDSILVNIDQTGWCHIPPLLKIRRTSGLTDYGTSYSHGNTLDQAHYISEIGLYKVELLPCFNYDDITVYLQITYAPIIGVGLLVEQTLLNGTVSPITYAEAGSAVSYSEVSLAIGDSIHITSISLLEECDEVQLTVHHSGSDTATTLDPELFSGEIPSGGLKLSVYGSVLVSLSDPCGTAPAVAHLSITEDHMTGIGGYTEQRNILSFADGMIHVRTDRGGLLKLCSLAGQLIQVFDLPPGTIEHSFHTTGPAAGIYMAMLQHDNSVEVLRFALD